MGDFMIYYVETNLIAIVVGLILLIQGSRLSSKNETSQIIMNIMLSMLILISVSDIFAYYFRGKSYWGSEICDIVYFLSMAVGTYAWFVYVLVKMEISTTLRRTVLITGGPLILLSIAILLNPITNYVFTIDEQNTYHRGPGVLATWIVEWGYMLAALAINIRCLIKEKRVYKKAEIRGYLLFAFPMAIAAICQMVFYGITTTQIGYMIAMLMLHANKQQYQAQRDELTGMNNKNAFLNYQDSIVSRSNPVDVTLFMLDADDFKSINDIYGHLKGDQALKDISNALKTAAGAFAQNRVILFRYGGDEFVIAGKDLTEENIIQLQSSIYECVEKINQQNRKKGESYHLAISIGIATRSCKTLQDFDELMNSADMDMYNRKNEKKL